MAHSRDTAATEAALVSRVAVGDRHAFDVLVARHHAAVALLARLVAPEGLREGLVAATFEFAHTRLRRLQGPTESVRPFVLMLARRLHEQQTQGSAPGGHLLLGKPFREPGAGEMHPAVCVEFSRLPEAWQLLVWQLEVEGDTGEGPPRWSGSPPRSCRPWSRVRGPPCVVPCWCAIGHARFRRSAWRTRCASAAPGACCPPGRCCGTPRSASSAPCCWGTSTPSSGISARWWRGTCWVVPLRTTWRYAAAVPRHGW